jgi:hypothetical protein
VIDPSSALLAMLQALLLLNWPVAAILTRAALHKPHIWALTIMAISSTLVALGVTAYVVAVLNAVTGGPFDQEQLRIIFRGVLVGIALFPILFLWLYRTERFRDGPRTDALGALESSVQEGLELTREGIVHSQAAGDKADAAYHEANSVNEKIAALTELVGGKEDKS